MDAIRSGWFSELNSLWPGQCFSLEVDEVLYQEKSKYQDILVFKSKSYGTVLVLDGIIQCTGRDEFSYQEMISHIPLMSHPNPRSVLVVGGGDGGVVREVVKHPEVEEVHLCEIDQQVIEVSKQYLPNMSVGFSSPKLTVHIEDGAEFMKRNESQFDVIITDSSDPVGPAKPLFEKPYYDQVEKALKPGGIMCCQGECQWLHLDLIRSSLSCCRGLFPVVSYAYTTIPSYPSGQIGFLLASKDKATEFHEPLRRLTREQLSEMNLRYYNSDVHRASFVLPQFVRDKLDGTISVVRCLKN